MAIDGNPHTAWQTQFYKGNPVFGGLKKGPGSSLTWPCDTAEFGEGTVRAGRPERT